MILSERQNERSQAIKKDLSGHRALKKYEINNGKQIILEKGLS